MRATRFFPSCRCVMKIIAASSKKKNNRCSGLKKIIPSSDPAAAAMDSVVSGLNVRMPVYLNVYDLTPVNGYMYWFGLGMFHSGIEVHGVEYSFGAHEFATSGVFEVVPRSCPGFTFRKAIVLGTTDLSPMEFREFIENMSTAYTGDSYHLILRNCNHFTNEVSMRLTGNPIPGWINRLAKIGMFSFGSCIMCYRLRVHHQNPPPMLKYC